MTNFLSVVWDINPILFKIGPLAIRWYSLLFVSGFPLGCWIISKFYKNEGVDPAKIEPLLYAMLIGVIIGARLGHCWFYQPDYFLAPFVAMFGGKVDPHIAQQGMTNWQAFWETFMPWKGGLASHGGAIGILLGLWWYTHKYGKANHFDMLWIIDRLVICVCFAGALIRIGNLFNSEIYGNETSLPWGFIFARNGETVPKHPTQIYEALSYILLGVFLLIMYWKRLDKLYRGWIFGAFLIGCFGMRILIEFIKQPQVEFEKGMALNMGQLLSIPFVLAGIFFIIRAYIKKTPARAIIPEQTNYCPPKKQR